jgi:hypothetical protein
MWRGGGDAVVAEAAEAAAAAEAAGAAEGVAADRLRLLTLHGGHKLRSATRVHHLSPGAHLAGSFRLRCCPLMVRGGCREAGLR